MAVTEAESSIAFALKEFIVRNNQQLELSLQKSTREAFNTAINSINSGDIKIAVSDSKNADKIRQGDADLKIINAELKKAESLKPKNCNCDCTSQKPVADTAFEGDYR